MATATISHWGIDVEAEPASLLEEPAFSLLQRPLADTFVEIEKWDLKVGKASMRTVADGDGKKIVIHAVPDMVRPDGQGPRTVTHEVHCCPDCSIPWADGQLHPENGCPYGTVDHVMST
jgi:hypothetical protein